MSKRIVKDYRVAFVGELTVRATSVLEAQQEAAAAIRQTPSKIQVFHLTAELKHVGKGANRASREYL